MSATEQIYPDMDAFNAADPRRNGPHQCDYGVHWRLDGWQERWRVSYVRDTGEIYAVLLGRTLGPVFVLGTVPPDPTDDQNRRYWGTLEQILDGWAERCAEPNSLAWVRDRLADQNGEQTGR